jgi:hypothetical protein
MKYLFIFLPFFCFANNDSIPDHLPWDTIPGGDSTLYGVRFDSITTHEITAYRSSGWFYYGGDLNLHRYVTPRDTLIPVEPRTIEYAPNGGSDGRWKYCDQHLFEGKLEPRPYWDQPVKVKLLVWNGCSLIEIEVDKIVGYRIEGRIREGSMMTIKVDTKVDFTTHYIVKGWHIKPSHVIKEL